MDVRVTLMTPDPQAMASYWHRAQAYLFKNNELLVVYELPLVL
jgi:hypothetical protein